MGYFYRMTSTGFIQTQDVQYIFSSLEKTGTIQVKFSPASEKGASYNCPTKLGMDSW